MAAPERRDARRDHAAIRRLADELLPALMARLAASPLGELEVSQDGWRLRLRKPAVSASEAHAAVPDDGKRSQAGPGVAALRDGRRDPSPERRDPSPERRETPRRVVSSPAVGTWHPLAGTSVGKTVRGGDVVGHVEVLGVPQEVVAPFDGILGRLLVEAGQVVEYGEPLIRFELAGAVAEA